jgi:peptidyl-prolyl cis-trans isomerase B (cyclophilin B)
MGFLTTFLALMAVPGGATAGMVRIGAATYPSLQAAYAVAGTGSILQLQNSTSLECLFLNRNIDITLKGGYDPAFGSNDGGHTTINAPLIIGTGSITMENLIISGPPVVTLNTSMGVITITLFPCSAPVTVQNFLTYVRDGFYDGLVFHRVIKNFMIQGGWFDTNFNVKTTRGPILNEANNGLSNKRGTVAMARTSVVDSATSQFFINTVDNTFLDYRGATPELYGYAVFGEVTGGMDVVDAISSVATMTYSSLKDFPTFWVIILSARSTP